MVVAAPLLVATDPIWVNIWSTIFLLHGMTHTRSHHYTTQHKRSYPREWAFFFWEKRIYYSITEFSKTNHVMKLQLLLAQIPDRPGSHRALSAKQWLTLFWLRLALQSLNSLPISRSLTSLTKYDKPEWSFSLRPLTRALELFIPGDHRSNMKHIWSNLI